MLPLESTVAIAAPVGEYTVASALSSPRNPLVSAMASETTSPGSPVKVYRSVSVGASMAAAMTSPLVIVASTGFGGCTLTKLTL
jgi:hypothetical protein